MAQAASLSLLERTAGAPISWGICEVPGWGHQLPVDRVLGEMSGLGLTATELGSAGYLPTTSKDLRAVLTDHGLGLIAAFVPLVLHDPDQAEAARVQAVAAAELLQGTEARYFVTAIIPAQDDWSHRELSEPEWTHLLAMLDEIDAISRDHDLQQVVHAHFGTLIERKAEVDRLLAESSVGLCLDTGHLLIGGTDPLDFAVAHGARVHLVHLKDVTSSVAARLNTGELGLMEAVQQGLFVPLGEGNIPIRKIIETLENAGYEGWYVIEQDVAITGSAPAEGEGPVRDVERSLAYLRSLEA